MEIKCFTGEFYHEGVLLLRYRLEYPAAEGFFSFWQEMAESYRSYLEGAYLDSLCQRYDADTSRRKRYRYEAATVRQRVRVYTEGALISFAFDLDENGAGCRFGLTFDQDKEILLPASSFSHKHRGKLFFVDRDYLYVFDKKGKLFAKEKRQA